jgi:hypothetical protein
MAAATAAQALALHKYFVNPKQVPAASFTALIDASGLTGSTDYFARKDTKAEELNMYCREMYHPPTGGGVPALAHCPGGGGRGGKGRSGGGRGRGRAVTEAAAAAAMAAGAGAAATAEVGDRITVKDSIRCHQLVFQSYCMDRIGRDFYKRQGNI